MTKPEDIMQTVLETNYKEPALPVQAEAFYSVVESRRSVRVYTNDPIPEAVVRRCLRAATMAPSSSNLQPWGFYWVTSPNKKAELIQACMNQPTARTAAELIVCVARTKTWPQMAKQNAEFIRANSDPAKMKSALDYYEKLVPRLHIQGPLGIIGYLRGVIFWLMGFKKPVPRGMRGITEMRLWAVKSTALACENLMLAFRAEGYDTCPMEGMDGARIIKLLDIPGDAEVVMVVSAGKRAPNGVYGPRIRFDENQFIFKV